MASLDTVWHGLRADHEKAGAAAESFSLRLVESTPAVRVFAAWGGNLGGPGLLVDFPLSLRKAIRSQLSSRAFSVQTAEYPGLAKDRVGVMTSLSDGAYADLFQLLCNELQSSVCSAPTEQAAATALQRVIDRWRHFVERRSTPLSPQRIRGLVGEAAVLMRLVSVIGATTALTEWTGPHDALRDFELGDASVEVKTYQAQSGSSVRISDPGQLEATSARPVYLCVVEIAGSVTSGRTLPEVVDALSSAVADQPGAIELLEEKLAQYGYLSAHATLYTEPYAVGRARLYAIAEGFPRLSTAMIPPGVDDVEFSIKLAAIKQFEVDAASIVGPPTSLEGSSA